MIDSNLKKYIGRQCQVKPKNSEEWFNGKLVAVYSEIISLDGYPYQRDGLQIRTNSEAAPETVDD